MTVDEKIALFRSLFKGRDDVFAQRFESRRTGRSGYQPACANEWVRGICQKPKIRCANCVNRRLLPVTDEVVYDHLSGKVVMGTYPMLADECCFFLAIDFDKGEWINDVKAVSVVCSKLNLPRVVERSRSGKGVHVWFFFGESLPAVLARKLGSHILTETMVQCPDTKLNSYDRLFPNQDTLPKGGFGNLIALPLQKKAREQGNSVFVDDALEPFSDQWHFLSSVNKLNRLQVEAVVAQAERRGRIMGIRVVADEETKDRKPPRHGLSHSRFALSIPSVECPSSLQILLANELFIEKEGLPAALINQLIRVAAFQNPEFYKAQAMRLPTYRTPRVISCAMDYGNYLGLPRGCITDVLDILKRLKIKPIVCDERSLGKPIDMTFKGVLRSEQVPAAETMLEHNIGVLSATTAFGKTVIGAWLIAKRGVNTLILVHRRQLLDQWRERLAMFLDVPLKEIGQMGGGRDRGNGKVDVAIIQSLIRKKDLDERMAQYGHIMVDECHHLSAFSFEQVVRLAPAKYITGLTATVMRKDGHHPIILMQCGPVRHRVNAKKQAVARPFQHEVMVRPTSFQTFCSEEEQDVRGQFQSLYKELMADDSRNQLIGDDVVKAVRAGRSPVVLTERTAHLDVLEELLKDRVNHLIIMRGGMGVKQRRQIQEQLLSIPPDEERVLLATGRYLGEGFDDARLDTLFLVLPVSWRGTIAQYAGRLHRLNDQKTVVRIYDYADLNVPMLSRMFDRRCKGYEAIGYTLLLPASAVPGWPTEVPLPIEPEWKRDYAASVKRIIRDGVNTDLGNLFVWATQRREGGQGVERARSATEAFLWRRLESLPATTGHFVLNEKLPIPFDGKGSLEVDFLCEELKLALEIDGAQHLADAEAYRRDRRKDLSLQENGYFVLRFLAEDVGKQLDDVLDGIHRVMAHRRRRVRG